jgi:hypothetical protein
MGQRVPSRQFDMTKQSSLIAGGPRPSWRNPTRTLDTNHWLTAGNDGETQVMTKAIACLFRSLNNRRNVGVYAAKDKLIASA